MSLTSNNKGLDKTGGKTKTHNPSNSKFIMKPGKASSPISKKPVKTGGMRGS